MDDTGRMFYCVKCFKLLSVDQARQLFRTGFYRIEYPLGLCECCLRSAASR